MNKKISFAAAVCYVAPAAIELEACSEGVLCASMSSGTIESAVEENWGEL